MPRYPDRATLATKAVNAAVVEAETVDERLRFDDAEHARPRIAGLGARRHRACFDEAETQRGKALEVRSILVETRGETHAVRKAKAHGLDRRLRQPGSRELRQAHACGRIQAAERDIVRALGVRGEEQRSKQRIQRVHTQE